MHEAGIATVERSKGIVGAPERELVRRETIEREFPEQLCDPATTPLDRPPVREGGRDSGHLAAADCEPTAVEVGPKWERDRRCAVPRAYEYRPLCRQKRQSRSERRRVPADLDDQRNAVSSAYMGDALSRVAGSDCFDTELAR